MTLSIQPSLPSPARPGPVPSSGTARPGPGTPTPGDADSARFSPASVLLAQLHDQDATAPPRLPPAGSEPARQLAALLAERLGVLFRDAGLPMRVPVLFEVDDAGRVRVASQHPEAGRMQAVIDSHADVQAWVRTLHAIDLSRAGPTAAALLAAASQNHEATGVRDSSDAINASAPRSTPPSAPPWNDWAAALLGREGRDGQRPGRLGWMLLAALVLVLLMWAI